MILFAEALQFIELLKFPHGSSVEIIAVEGAPSAKESTEYYFQKHPLSGPEIQAIGSFQMIFEAFENLLHKFHLLSALPERPKYDQ